MESNIKPVGLGDFVKAVTDRLGIKLSNCGCQRRQEQLNKIELRQQWASKFLNAIERKET